MDIKVPLSLLKKHLETQAKPEDLVEALSLCGPTVDRVGKYKNETVLEIEAITNRVDSASILGVAREAGAILPEFGFDAKVINKPEFDSKLFGDKRLSLDVQIMDQSLVPRFCAVVLDNVEVKPSEQETIDWLNATDVRDLNNVVDVTNELTLRYGQPSHVFDYDKIEGHKMIVRESKRGEKVQTLDGKTHTLQGKDIVIEDGKGRLIDLCGIMGGQLSCVDQNTKRIVLFVQTYEPKHIRRTSLYLQQRTLAAQIFEKNPDIEMVDKVLCEGAKMLSARSGAKVASELIDIYPSKIKLKVIRYDVRETVEVAGLDIDQEHQIRILERLGFEVRNSSGALEVVVPSYRDRDIDIKQDITEEILRVYGYFRLPSILPTTQIVSNAPSKLLTDEIKAKRLLSNLGYNEVFNYSLTSKKTFEKANIKLSEYVVVSNPLNEDFEIMRTSLIPQMIQVVGDNVGKAPRFDFYELSNVYVGYKDGTLPEERSSLCIVSNKEYSHLKGVIESVGKKMRWELEFYQNGSGDCFAQSVEIKMNNISVGVLGIVDIAVLKNFGVNFPVCIAEMNFGLLSSMGNTKKVLRPIPVQTPTYKDITVDSKKSVGELMKKIKSFDESIYDLEYLDSYKNKKTFRIYFYNEGPVDIATCEEVTKKLIRELD